MLQGKRVKHIKAFDVSDTLGEWGEVIDYNNSKAYVEFDTGQQYNLPHEALSLDDAPVHKIKTGDYVRYIGGSRWFGVEWIGTIFYYDGRFRYYDSMSDHHCFYEKVDLSEGTMFKITNTREIFNLPDKVLDDKVHRIKSINETKIIFEYKDKDYVVKTWNITPIEDEEPRVNDTVYYNNRYLGVTEVKDGLLTLKNGVKALVEKCKLYRRRPKGYNTGKQVIYNSGLFNNTVALPLQSSFEVYSILSSYNGKILAVGNEYGIESYLTPEDVEVMKLEGEYIFIYTDLQEKLIKDFEPKVKRKFELEDYSLFQNKETGVDFAVKYKKSDRNFYQAKNNRGRRFRTSVYDKIRRGKRFTIKGKMFQATQKMLEFFDGEFVENGDFVRNSIEVEDAVVYVYEVKRKTLNEFKQKTKIING